MSEDHQVVVERRWKRSSTCNSGTCVEIMTTPDAVHMRDNRDVATVLTFAVTDWAAFVSEACGRSGPGEENPIHALPVLGRVVVGHRDERQELMIARPDWDVFIEGVRAGEFNA